MKSFISKLQVPNGQLAFFTRFDDDLVDEMQAFMQTMPQCEEQLVHRFSPGLYSRELTLPAAAICISLVHNTEHQYVVSKGTAVVWSKTRGVQIMRAPCAGVTLAGERRIFFVQEEFRITNFHATTETDPEKFIAGATSSRDVSHIKKFDPFITALFEPVKELK